MLARVALGVVHQGDTELERSMATHQEPAEYGQVVLQLVGQGDDPEGVSEGVWVEHGHLKVERMPAQED